MWVDGELQCISTSWLPASGFCHALADSRVVSSPHCLSGHIELFFLTLSRSFTTYRRYDRTRASVQWLSETDRDIRELTSAVKYLPWINGTSFYCSAVAFFRAFTLCSAEIWHLFQLLMKVWIFKDYFHFCSVAQVLWSTKPVICLFLCL